MSQLILLEHLCFDQRLESINLAISLALYKLDLAESTLSDNLDGLEVRRCLLCSQESKEVRLSFCDLICVLALLFNGYGGFTNCFVEFRRAGELLISII